MENLVPPTAPLCPHTAQLTSLVVEFMQSGQVDPAVQVSFREFLSEKATT